MQNVDSITRPVMIPVTLSSSGDNTVIASSSINGEFPFLYVRQIVLTAPGGAQDITIKDGSTVKSVIHINANDGVVLESTYADYPFLFDCEPGNDLIINLSAATSVKGHIVYGYRK